MYSGFCKTGNSLIRCHPGVCHITKGILLHRVTCVYAVLLCSLLANSESVCRMYGCQTSATLRVLTWMNHNRIPITWRIYLNFSLKSGSTTPRQVFRLVCKIWEKRLLASTCLPVRLSSRMEHLGFHLL